MAGKTDQEKARQWIQETHRIHTAPNPDLKKVIAGYRKGLSYNQADAEGHYFLGVAYLGTGQFAQALEEFDLALNHRPEFPDVFFHRGQALINLRRFPEAVKSFEQALKFNPEATPLLYSLGFTYQAMGEREQAEKYFQQGYAKNPQDKPGIMQYLMFLSNTQQNDKALEVVEAFLADSPQDRDVRNFKALVLINLKQAAEARELLLELTEQHPTDGGIKFNLAQAHEMLQDEAAAEPLYREALELNPHYLPVYTKLGTLLSRRRDFDEALAIIEQGLAIEENDPNLRYSRALVLADLGRQEEAETILNQLLNDFPDFTAARNVLERLNQTSGKVPRGLEAIEQELKEKPDDPELELELGRAHLHSRGFEQAIELMEKHREQYEGDPAFLADLGFAYAGRAQQEPELLTQAEQALNASLDLKGEQPAVLLQLARLALNQAEPQNAFDYAVKCEEAGGEIAQTANVKGYATLQKGFAETALSHFAHSLELQPQNNLEAISNLAQLSDFTEQREQAESYYRQWCELAPQDITPLMKLAMMQVRFQTPDAAVATYDRVVELKPEEAAAYFMQAMVLKELGRIEEAIEKLQKAVEVKPDYSEAAFYLKQFEQSRPLGISSVEELEEGVTEDPENYDDRYLLGYLYLHMRRFAEAAEQLEAVSQHDPDNFRARFELADALFQAGERDRAIDIMISLEEKVPRDAGLRFRLADMLESNQEYDLALKEFENAVEMMPQNLNFQYRLGMALINADKEAKGEEKLRKVLEQQEQFAPAWLELGKLEMTSDRPDSALQSFDNALRHNRNLIDALYYKGLVYRNQLQDEREALRHFRAVLGFRWESPDAHFQLGEMLKAAEPEAACQHFELALRFWSEADFNYERAAAQLQELKGAE